MHLFQTLILYAQTGFAVIHLQKSVLLYDFLVNNSLCIGNFAFKQSAKYTYSKGKHRFYIDHVLVPKYLMPTVRGCVILEVPSNTSDHMPIKTSISLDLDNSSSAVDSMKEYPNTGMICPYIDWSNLEITKQYESNIVKAAKQIKLVILNGIVDKSHATQVVKKDKLLSEWYYS